MSPLLHHDPPHIVPPRTYWLVFAALMALLVLTVGAAFVPLGPLSIFVSMGIAVAKAALVVLFFMHQKYAGALARIALASGIAWLFVSLLLTLSDYLTRG